PGPDRTARDRGAGRTSRQRRAVGPAISRAAAARAVGPAATTRPAAGTDRPAGPTGPVGTAATEPIPVTTDPAPRRTAGAGSVHFVHPGARGDRPARTLLVSVRITTHFTRSPRERNPAQ